MSKLSAIEGIGPVYEAKLQEVGITTVEGLLEKTLTKKARVELAEQSGIFEKLMKRRI